MKIHHQGFVDLAGLERKYEKERAAHARTKKALRIAVKALENAGRPSPTRPGPHREKCRCAWCRVYGICADAPKRIAAARRGKR